MDLEQKVKQTTVIRRLPPNEVLEQVKQGKRFVVVQTDFDWNAVPQGYSLIDMRYKGESFKALVPQSLLFFMANPGEGDIDVALEQIAEFYKEAEEIEDGKIENGETSVQQANWATTARSAYHTYLINKLVQGKGGAKDEHGEPVPEFDPGILTQLDLDDRYVAERVRAMAALALGKSGEGVKKYDIGSVLKHVTIQGQRREALTREEFKKITCWAGSHYELKAEYRNNPDVEYHIESRHSREHIVGYKTTKKIDVEVFDAKIAELEREIGEYRKKKGSAIGRHDKALMRQYANLAYIAPESPKAQLDITPPVKNDG